MPRFWIGVASRDHVKKGEAGGFCQLCHGKAWAVNQLSPGEWIAYYSPKAEMRAGTPVRAFTAIGQIVDRPPYAVEMQPDFTPTRRDVHFMPATEAPIAPLINELSFINNKQHWGMVFRRGIQHVPRSDFQLIANAMGISIEGLVARRCV